MTFLSRLFGDRHDREALRRLYAAGVAAARDRAWYREGAVPDTLDGRFDMVATIVSLLLIRLEAEGEAAKRDAVLLTELFIEDMDGVLRQIGIGDVTVGKHVGKLMGALGGRLGAFRSALAGEAELEPAVVRNIFRGAAPAPAAIGFVARRLEQMYRDLAGRTLEQLRAGELGAA